MEKNYSTTGIIMAAGSSKRFGQNKILADLLGKPVIVHAVEAFEKSNFVNSIIIVTSESIKSTITKLAKQYEFNKIKAIILGGKTRQESVKNALDFIKENDINCPYIAIHDGARPLIDAKSIDKCIQGAVKYKATALGIRPKDTIKQSETPYSKTISNTFKRELLWAIQTPQAFEFNILYEAHERAIKDNFSTTDDCALVEKIGIQPEVIEGDYRNLKITTPEDIDIATVLLKTNIK